MPCEEEKVCESRNFSEVATRLDPGGTYTMFCVPQQAAIPLLHRSSGTFIQSTFTTSDKPTRHCEELS
jgi:hypothetical protein